MFNVINGITDDVIIHSLSKMEMSEEHLAEAVKMFYKLNSSTKVIRL